MDYLNSLLPTIENFGLLGYWIIFLLSIVESVAFIGLFVPGTVLLVAIGALCAKGILNVGDVIWFASAGAVVGDIFSFYLGRHGTRLASRWDKIIHSSYMEHGERFLEAHGNKSVFLGRFIGPLRPVIPFVAGFFRMQSRRFIFWDIISAPCWAVTYVYMGYFFGQAWEFSKFWTSRGGILLITFCIILGILYFLRWEILKRGREFFAFFRFLWGSFSQAVAMNHSFQLVVSHHPVLFRFIARRADRRTFYGLPLTLLCVAFLYTLFLFLGLIEDIITSDAIAAVDVRFVNLLAVFRTPGVTEVMTWITLLGKGQVIAVFALVLTLVLLLWRRMSYIMPLWLTLAGSQFFILLGKIAFQRQRPAVALYPETSYSFPSGHATMAMAFYGFLIYIILKQIKSYNKRLNLVFAVLIMLLAIGFARIYMGVHFLSDVWAGYLLGGIWLIIGMSLVSWERTWIKTAQPVSVRPVWALKTATAGLAGIGLVFYLWVGYRYDLPEMPLRDGMPPAVLGDNIPMSFKLQRLPLYTETLSGYNQEPLSILILAHDDRQLFKAFHQAGWFQADEVDLKSLARAGFYSLMRMNYPTAPIPPSFWDNRVQDFGFERSVTIPTYRRRHHARIWKSHVRSQEGQVMYVGTASLDIGALWGISHKIWPDIDTEREYLLQSLLKTGMVAWYHKVAFVDPVKGQDINGNLFSTDGDLYLVKLK
ncbi:MAG: LssY C-terminal domain-containing protein [Syntrophaceae bacterium]